MHLKTKLSFKLKWDISTNIENEITLWCKRQNPRLRPIPLVESDKAQ